MEQRISRFRLTSTAFRRSDEENQIDPKRIIILSVEGSETERAYFQHLNRHLDGAVLQIEVLRHRRGDGYSDPQQVVDLLNEYLALREGDLVPEELQEEFRARHSQDEIRTYLNNPDQLPQETRNAFQDDLMRLGIDLEYRRYLKNFDNETDLFAVVLDRDCGSHSRELLENCFRQCQEKDFKFYLTNPCFEFWLLLHLCNAKITYSPEKLEAFKENPQISHQHTLVSQELSRLAHHNKKISSAIFNRCYFPNIQKAIANVQAFKTSYPELLDDLGSNLPELFDVLGLS